MVHIIYKASTILSNIIEGVQKNCAVYKVTHFYQLC